MLILGHLEENESNMDAAVRETEEEAGIKVKDLSVDHNFEKVLKVNFIWFVAYIIFLCSLVNNYSCYRLYYIFLNLWIVAQLKFIILVDFSRLFYIITFNTLLISPYYNFSSQ